MKSTRYHVAPFMGAWIEIDQLKGIGKVSSVAPFMGAWIEIVYQIEISSKNLSHPSWVRGLKYCDDIEAHKRLLVAPFMGAWIEI